MIEGITDKDTSELIKIYEQAESEIIDTLKDTDFYNLVIKAKVLKQVQNVLVSLYKPTEKFITSKSKSEYQSGIQEVQEALGKLDFKGSFNLVDPKATQFVMENLKSIQESAFSDVRNVLSNSYQSIESSLNLIAKKVKNEYATQIASDIVSNIASKQALGKSRKEISMRLVDLITDKGVTGISYVTESGKQRNLSLSAYVDGLTRQVLITSRASAIVSTALEMGQDLLKISTHSKESKMCKNWSGKIVSITGKTDGYPTLSDALFKDYKRGGIMHRFCRHSLRVYIPTDIQFK